VVATDAFDGGEAIEGRIVDGDAVGGLGTVGLEEGVEIDEGGPHIDLSLNDCGLLRFLSLENKGPTAALPVENGLHHL
jgi:hypothetical protein